MHNIPLEDLLKGHDAISNDADVLLPKIQVIVGTKALQCGVSGNNIQFGFKKGLPQTSTRWYKSLDVLIGSATPHLVSILTKYMYLLSVHYLSSFESCRMMMPTKGRDFLLTSTPFLNASLSPHNASIHQWRITLSESLYK